MQAVRLEEPRTYRLRSGCYYRVEGGKTVYYKPGDVITSNIDMLRLEGPDRWERVDDVTGRNESIADLRARIKILEGSLAAREAEAAKPLSSEDDGLEGKTIKELRELAADMEPPVDLSGITTKDAIIAAIRHAIELG